MRRGAFTLLAFLAALPPHLPARERLLLDANWRFQKSDPGNAAASDFDDSSWRRLNLPHDWGIEGPFDPHGKGDTARLPYWGIAWYRRHLALPASDVGQRICLQIDGAMSHSTVWVNGEKVGGWPYGYASYEVDLTGHVKPGADNVLAIRLDNPPDSSRWYPGGGIYRHVWLVKTAPVHVAHWGTYLTTPTITADAAAVQLRVVVQDNRHAAVVEGAEARASAEEARGDGFTLKTEIFELGRSGRPSGEAVVSGATPLALKPGASTTVTQSISLPHPMLWSTRSPYRYVAVTSIRDAQGSLLDTYETPFGVRRIAFDPARGFLLNGEPLRLQGVCDHHDLGALGAAINERALERQLEELQEMGCNAIRTSHNPPAPELLDLCDRLGFVVMDEAFDCWTNAKRPNDYHRLFPEWHDRDLRAMIRRDRNHPCVILWSIGNEIPEQKTPQEGIRIGRELQAIAHEEDRTRPVTSACNFAGSADNGFASILDVVGYNYHWAEYARFRQRHPNTFLFGSETASTVSSRGVYVFPVSDDKSQGMSTPGHQVSSYDLSAPRWAWPPDPEFRAEDDNPGVGGEFVWTGWDYLGEPTPYGGPDDPSRSSYFGIIDLAGFRKDRFYLYQSRWRHDLPMAHLLPHWTWPGRVGKVTPVFVYTSGDEAELFINGQSQGRRKLEPGQYRLRWNDVVYRPGELKVVAYRKGRKWAQDAERTAGDAAALRAAPDRQVVKADGRDLVFVSVAVEDAKGVFCPTAANRVRFAVEGPGDVIATDNGDATSFEPFQAPAHRAFNGRVLAIVRTRPNSPGTIRVTAASDGLAPAAVEVRSNDEAL